MGNKDHITFVMGTLLVAQSVFIVHLVVRQKSGTPGAGDRVAKLESSMVKLQHKIYSQDVKYDAMIKGVSTDLSSFLSQIEEPQAASAKVRPKRAEFLAPEAIPLLAHEPPRSHKPKSMSGTTPGVFCVITSHRNVSYLADVLNSMEPELASVERWRTLVVDVDGSAGPLETQKLSLLNRTIEDCGNKPDIEGIPGCKARQQTLDTVAGLNECAKHASEWIVLVEDDTEMCTGAMDIIDKELKAMNRQETNAVKFAKSFTGTAFPKETLPKFGSHALNEIFKEPIDRSVLWKDNGANAWGAHRNLFKHVGTVSTFGYRNSKEYLKKYSKGRSDKCYDPMGMKVPRAHK